MFSFCKRTSHKRYQNIYNAECPVCKEGKSAGRSKRLFYFPAKNYFYCHNCVRSWRPMEWVREVTGLSLAEIFKKNNEKIGLNINFKHKDKSYNLNQNIITPDLPDDSIDLTDETQVLFYKPNKFISAAQQYCVDRRLLTATNTCGKFFISLTDKVHRNRLIIPFYDDLNKISCYQTRALTTNQFPKYLTKFGEKTVFGLNNITEEIPYIFIFEGPIDSMFVKNGVAVASFSPTEKQTMQINSLIGYKLIYVFDNDKNNKQTSKKIESHIKSGKTVFVWPKEFLKFKDFNEVCCKLKINEIPWNFIVNNSYSGPEALIKQKLLK